MSLPKISVALLTRNRPDYLRLALDSILAQEGVEFEVLVFDNASTDETPDVVRGYADPRLIDMRLEENIGAVRNWNRALRLAAERSPLVSLFHDDDIMLPGFLAESASALAAHPSAGMSLCLSELITADGTTIVELAEGEMPHPGDLQDGLNNGLDFLELTLNRRGMRMGIYPTSIVFRSEVLRRLGPIDSPHVRATMDMNLYFRLARHADVVFIRKVLGQWRQHGGSETDRMGRMAEVMFRYGVVAEVLDIAAYLLQTPRAADPQYRQWLGERMLSIHAEQSELIRPLCPQAYHAWDYRRSLLFDQIERVVPPGEALVLIDDAQLAPYEALNGRRVVPLTEADGEYTGTPQDSVHAVEELERHRRSGIRWLVVSWPSMWYLEIYPMLRHRLHDRYRCASREPHGLIFDLTEVQR